MTFISSDMTIQLCAVQWLKDFLQLSGPELVCFCPGIVQSVLPTLSYMDERIECRDSARQVNSLLLSLITPEYDKPT